MSKSSQVCSKYLTFSTFSEDAKPKVPVTLVKVSHKQITIDFRSVRSLLFEVYVYNTLFGLMCLIKIASCINAALDVHFPVNCGVDVIAEPGCYYVESAFTLATRVDGRRTVVTDKETKPTYDYYVNDGIYGSLNRARYNEQFTFEPLVPPPADAPRFNSTIWGPTCDSVDVVIEKTSLPLIERDDWIVWENLGAYTLVSASCFNGFPVPEVIAVAQKHTALYLKESPPMYDFRFVDAGQHAVACLKALDLGTGITVPPKAAS